MYESAEEAALRHPEYHRDFYAFLCETVVAAQDIAYQGKTKQKHLSSSDIYLAFCSMMQRQYGPLSMAMLTFWGVKSPNDIGRAIFYLVEEGAIVSTKSDKQEDFSYLPALEVMLDLPFHAPSS